MGKGVVYSGGSKGKYLVTLDYGTEIRDAKLVEKNARKSVLEGQISDLEAVIVDITAQKSSDTNAVSAAIDVYNASEKTEEDRERLEDATLVPIGRQNDLSRNQQALNDLLMQLASVDSDIAMLNSAVLTETKTVWCADYTENASGTVGIIEIDAEQPTFVMAPGGEAWNSNYGLMVSREVQEGFQVYYNAAILPGVQKWSPTFRSGVIEAIDYDNHLCSVDLDPAKSSAQSLDINVSDFLTSVPVSYMSCDSYAFESGDKVVVYFQDQNPAQPVVIGFVTNPRPCGSNEIFFLVERSTRHVDPAQPRGKKFRGVLLSNGEVTYPYQGYYEATGNTYSADEGDENTGGGALTYDPEQFDPHYDPADVEGYIDDLRIRFDVGWSKSFTTEPVFVIDALDVTSHDDVVEMPASADGLLPNGGTFGLPPGGGFLGGDGTAMGDINFAIVPRWVTAASGSAPWGWESYLNFNWITDPELPIWHGTEPTSYGYAFQGWTGFNYANTAYYRSNDVEHASDWLLQAYDPPRTITVIKDLVEYEYEFVRIGGAPRTEDLVRTVPVTDPAPPAHTVEYDTKGEVILAVVYRLVGLV